MDTGQSITRRAYLLFQLSLVFISPTDGGMAQAELTWLLGSAPTMFTRLKTVTHPGTNRAQRKVDQDQRVTTKPNRHWLLLLLVVGGMAQW